MEEKEDQSPKVSPSTPRPDPSTDLRTSDRGLLRVDPEEEKKREVDLNALFPGKGYDLNRLFPDEGTKKLLFELRRNKREIERFIKNLDLEEK
jgi:hypothetical protein